MTTTSDAALADAPFFPRHVILVADDNVNVLHVTAAVLRDCGYAVLLAQNALEAALVSARCAGQIDLLLTDFNLGTNLGTDLAVLFQIVHPAIKVLIISGSEPGGNT